jgi:polysaccharide chain length determinant protein (PEP-CTERM system associated)
MHELSEQILSHLKAIWRYRWYAVIAAWIIALGGWVAVYLIPERYEATARVQVDTDSILRPLLAGLTVHPNLDQMVVMMGRTLISRPNVEKLIEMSDPNGASRSPEERERLIAHVTKELSLNSAGRENLYTISYVDKSPQQARQIVESMLKLFMEKTQGDQRKDSEAARHFIDEQISGYNDKLVAAENAMTEFKRRHMGYMSGDTRDYYTRLVEAQTALSQATLEYKEAEDGRGAIKKQLAEAEEIHRAMRKQLQEDEQNASGEVSSADMPRLEIDTRIQALEQKLDSLRLIYTEKHPDIVSTVRILDQLKEQRKLDLEQWRADNKRRKPRSSTPQAGDPVSQELTVRLSSAEANLASLKARVAEYGKRYAELQAAANAVPQLEAEYTQLTRDYEVTKKNYEALLSRRESAQISGDMETRAGATDFRVIDPPRVPSNPKWPNRRLLMSIVLIAALLGGLGVAYLVSQIRRTIHDERKLKEVSGLPVLGTVLMTLTDSQKGRRAQGLAALWISFVSLLSTYAAIMVMLALTTART